PRRIALRGPQGPDAGQRQGGDDVSQLGRSDRPADAPVGWLPAGHRARRCARALERPDLSLPARRLHLQDASRAALWQELYPYRADNQGWGRNQRGARAALRPLQISGRDERKGGQPKGKDPAWRKPVRGRASAQIPAPADEGAVLRRAVPE